MTVLIDTNIVLDIWTDDPAWSAWSTQAILDAEASGPLAVNPIIYAELCYEAQSEAHVEQALDRARIRRLQLPYSAAWPAARAFEIYRERGGARTSPLPDFFIGAHAQVEGMALLTRDASRYRTYFPEVRLITPTQRSAGDAG